MTANTAITQKVRSLSSEMRLDLIEQINGGTELNVLLDLFGNEIQKLGLVDGYLINLRDADAENLISLKVHFAPEFHFLEETYQDYKVPLVVDPINVSAKAFHSRGIIQCDADDGSEQEKQFLKLWRLNDIAAIAILDDDDFSQIPIGTLLLLKQDGHIEECTFDILDQLMAVFYKPLRNALEQSFLQEHKERYQTAEAEHTRFLAFVVAMNNLTAPEKIYPLFAAEIFRHTGFDGIGYFLLENDVLMNKKVISADPRNQDTAAAWETYMLGNPYLQDPTDGGVSHTFIKNIPIAFPDVQTIKNLPMSGKDRQTLGILKTARTMLMVPVRYRDHPIGVIMLYSLDAPITVSESKTLLIESLAALFGTAITNARNYAASSNHLK